MRDDVTPTVTNQIGDESPMYVKHNPNSEVKTNNSGGIQPATEEDLLQEIQIRARELDRRKEGNLNEMKISSYIIEKQLCSRSSPYRNVAVTLFAKINDIFILMHPLSNRPLCDTFFAR